MMVLEDMLVELDNRTVEMKVDESNEGKAKTLPELEVQR